VVQDGVRTPASARVSGQVAHGPRRVPGTERRAGGERGGTTVGQGARSHAHSLEVGRP
jgi:hypothetical protein